MRHISNKATHAPRFTKGHRRYGFTLVELLVAIVIIVVLASLALPLGLRMRKKAESSQCVSNLRQIALVVQGNASETGYYIPVNNHSTLDNGSLHNNGENLRILLQDLTCISCPSAKHTGVDARGRQIGAYGANPMVMGFIRDGTPPLVRTGEIRRPAEVMLMSDGAQFSPSNPRALGYNARWWGSKEGNPANKNKELTSAEIIPGGFWDSEMPTLPLRHGGTANVVFCDGHVETISRVGDLKERNFYTNY